MKESCAFIWIYVILLRIFVLSKSKQSTKQMENEQKTQLQRANEALVELFPSVTTSDRDEAKKEFSEFTVVQYLKGRGKNLDTALTLLQLFRKRINDREKTLA